MCCGRSVLDYLLLGSTINNEERNDMTVSFRTVVNFIMDEKEEKRGFRRRFTMA